MLRGILENWDEFIMLAEQNVNTFTDMKCDIEMALAIFKKDYRGEEIALKAFVENLYYILNYRGLVE